MPVRDPCAAYAQLDGARRPACLLVHGFTGAPRDMWPVADALVAQGYPVQLVALPGHCGEPDALNATTAADWYGEVVRAAEELHGQLGPLVIVGLSMGGLLALRLAAMRPELVRALVTMGAPTHLPRLSQVMLGAYRRLGRPRLLRVLPKPPRRACDQEKYFLSDPSPHRYPQGAYPMDASLEFDGLRADVCERLGAVCQPILVLHGARDLTAPLRSAFDVIEQVSSPSNRLVILRDSHHVLPMDGEREQVNHEICAFVGQLTAS